MAKLYNSPSMLIAGSWIGTTERPGSDIIDPATEEVIGQVPHATSADIDKALEAAAAGFEVWRKMSPKARGDILIRAADLLIKKADRLAGILTREQGKPFREAHLEILRAATILQWDANEGRRTYGRIIPSEVGFRQMVLKQPIGPVAAFTPWNYPIVSPARKLAGALAAGCSIILKGSEETPASAYELVKCLVEAGVPDGVISLLHGNPAAISDHLIRSPIIRAVTFTGSVPVGKHLAQLAASHMKPVIMELGGHAPVIVCDDVDPEKAGVMAAQTKFRNAGQVCVAPTRFIVQDRVYAPFLDSFVRATEALKIGNGLEDDTQMGPLANPRRLSAVEGLIADALERGGRIATGGTRIGKRGYFFQPTVLTDLHPDSLVLRDEPFGPIATVAPFEALHEAIDMANALPFGLASYAFTTSSERAAILADNVASGIMSINHLAGSQPETPFGGVKDSGLGREGGSEGLDAFMTTKFVSHKMCI